MTLEAVARAVSGWKRELAALKADPAIRRVQILENTGGAMGCSNPHPHSQIWASLVVPTIVQTERERQEDFVAKTK